MTNDYEKIGRKIASRRYELNYTQEKLAELVDVDVNTIYRYEKGELLSKFEKGAKLEKALNLNLKDLFEI